MCHPGQSAQIIQSGAVDMVTLAVELPIITAVLALLGTVLVEQRPGLW